MRTRLSESRGRACAKTKEQGFQVVKKNHALRYGLCGSGIDTSPKRGPVLLFELPLATNPSQETKRGWALAVSAVKGRRRYWLENSSLGLQ